MKQLLFLSLWMISSSTSAGQRKIESFPQLSDFADKYYAHADNIIPIATVIPDLDGKKYKIPVSYSLLHHPADSSNFLINGDFIDRYSFEISDNGKCKPFFKKETLHLPADRIPYLDKTRQRVDSIKFKIDLNNYLKFLAAPQCGQNDATPLCEDGSPMKFICQPELRDLTTDDCCLYVFLDPKRKLVKQIYQRD